MSKDPAFLFYPSDFLTGTMYMSFQEKGIYICLLCSQHQHGGIIDKVSFNSLVGDNIMLKSKFIESENGFYNERLAIEMDKRNKKSNNMSDAAKLVWDKRKAENDAIALQKQNKSKAKVKENDTIVVQPVNVNEDVNKNNLLKNNIPEFSEFLSEALRAKPNVSKQDLELKYKSWLANDWNDGNNKPIKNWKSKLLNTLPFIKENTATDQPTKKRNHIDI